MENGSWMKMYFLWYIKISHCQTKSFWNLHTFGAWSWSNEAFFGYKNTNFNYPTRVAVFFLAIQTFQKSAPKKIKLFFFFGPPKISWIHGFFGNPNIIWGIQSWCFQTVGCTNLGSDIWQVPTGDVCPNWKQPSRSQLRSSLETNMIKKPKATEIPTWKRRNIARKMLVGRQTFFLFEMVPFQVTLGTPKLEVRYTE